ncbi:MAG: PH domain-containing protein [Pseudomonadota bacterium]
MALVSCTECGGSVSDAAVACPRCGHPVNRMAAPARGAARVPGTEQILWEGTPSLKLLVLDTIGTALFAGAVIGGMALAYHPLRRFVGDLSKGSAAASTTTATFRLVVILFVATVVGVRLLRLVWRAVSLRHQRYRVSNQRLTVETGVIARSLVEVDMRTVDDITFNQGVIERLLKLGRIDVISSEPAGASGSHTRLRLIGIPEPRAVREMIRDAVYQATHGQLFTRST